MTGVEDRKMAAVVDLCDDSDSEHGTPNPTEIIDLSSSPHATAPAVARSPAVARAAAVSSMNGVDASPSPRKRRRQQHANSNATTAIWKPPPTASKVDDLHVQSSASSTVLSGRARREARRAAANAASQIPLSARKAPPVATTIEDLHVQAVAAVARKEAKRAAANAASQIPLSARKAPPVATTNEDLHVQPISGVARREAKRAAAAASQIPPSARKAPPEATTNEDLHVQSISGTARREAKRGDVRFKNHLSARKAEATAIEDDLNVKPPAVAKRPAPAYGLLEIVSVVAPPDPLAPIYEVFPDVERSHALELLSTHPDVSMVLMILANGEYPREKQTAGLPTAHTMHNGLTLTVKRSASAAKYDYLSPSSFEPSIDYQLEAGEQLLYDFPFLSKHGVSRIMQNSQGHFSIAREYVVNALMGKQAGTAASVTTEEQQEQQYRALKQALTSRRPDAQQVARFGHNFTVKRARPRPQSTPNISNPILEEEIEHVKQKLSNWMDDMEQRLKRKKARVYSQLAGTAVECSCCFDKVDMDEMVACKDEGHLFCVDCLKGYAESQIFSSGNLGIDKETKKPLLELKCPHGDGCDSGFPEVYLQKALPFKTLEKYNELQFQAAVEQAGLREDLCTCPKCGYQADLPPTQMIFQCPMEDCRVESCRKCGKEPHIPLRCEEVVQEKRQDEGRLKVEEAISAAKIRACPKCKVSFIKSDGCNKMTCSCGVWVCYICRQIVPKSTGYGHFCQKPHCTHASCKKCKLYSKVEEDDEMAMKEAGVDAAESFREELLKDTENNAEGVDVNIDVSAIMQDPTAASARKKRAVQLPPGMAGMAGMQADIALLLRRQHRQRAQRR